MTILVIAGLAIALATASGTAVALAIRNGGLKAENARIKARNQGLDIGLESTLTSLRKEKDRNRERIKILTDDLREMEDRLAACSDPAVVRAEFERVLQELSEANRDSHG